jgi:hypothetical protein
MAQRRNDYLEFGVALDRFAQRDKKTRAEGLAPSKGGERYALLMTVLSEIRLTRAVGQSARDMIGDEKSWAAWGNGMDRERPRGLRDPELSRLRDLYAEIVRYGGFASTVDSFLGGIDDRAALLFKALSAGGGSGAI